MRTLFLPRYLAGRYGLPVDAPPPDPDPDPDPGIVGPQPQAGDRILYDTRTTLQAATTEGQSKALFVHTSDNIYFTTNVDGNGTKAMRADYVSRPGECWDSGASMAVDLPAPHPKEVYYQYKQILGRTATGGGLGTIGRFQITNAECGNAGAKRFLTTRTGGGNEGRTDFIWPGGAPAHPWLVTDTGGLNQKQNQNLSGGIYLPQDHEGEVLTWTIYFKAESSNGAGDGAAKLWIDDTLLIETNTVGFTDRAFIGFHFPATFRAPQLDQSEYYWDILAWEPKHISPLAQVDFDSYSSTADLHAKASTGQNGFRIWAKPEDISLDQTDGVAGSSSCMLYTFPDRTGDSNRCGDDTRNSGLAFASQKEIWVDM